MRRWSAETVARAAGARLLRPGTGREGPGRAVIDSRDAAPGALFVGLPGTRVDGGDYAPAALAAGAWGALVAPDRAAAIPPGPGAVLAAEDPLAALGMLARGWRRELGAQVIGVTGSVGKTSTKDLLAAMLAPRRAVAASRANFNTEIGLPLEVLAAPSGTEVLVLELAMRGFGQIAELTAIAEPDVGVVTNVGPVHLELVGSLDGVARAKGELLEGLADGACAVVPADEPRLAPHLRPALRVMRFGPGGDVDFETGGAPAPGARVRVPEGAGLELELPFASAHQRRNALAAVAACLAVGVRPEGRVEVAFSALRGERVALGLGALVINDCYNANPLSMRAALDDLARQDAEGRRVAVLGDMLELGPDALAHHRAVGAHAADVGVEVLVTVGPLAAAMAEGYDGAGERHHVPDARTAAALAGELLAPGDLVLVKGSRGVGLEAVAEGLLAAEGARA